LRRPCVQSTYVRHRGTAADESASASDDGLAARRRERENPRESGGGSDPSFYYYGFDDDDDDDDDDDAILSACNDFISCITCVGGNAEESDEIEIIERRRKRRGDGKDRRREGRERREEAGRANRVEDTRRIGSPSGNTHGSSSSSSSSGGSQMSTKEFGMLADRTDPPGAFASERIEIEMSLSDDDDDDERPKKDAENDEDDSPILVTNDPASSSSARAKSSMGQRAAPSIQPTSSALCAAKSLARHRSAAPDVVATAMRDEGAAASSSIVPDDKREASVRAKSLTPRRWKSPFARAANKPSSFSEKASAGGVARRDGGAAIRSDPSSGTDDGRGIPLTSKIAIASGRSLAGKEEEEVWWEYTDEGSGRKYYSNGMISMWRRPVGGDISAAASSSSTASEDRSRVETASSNLESSRNSPSMEKRDQQGPLAENEMSKPTQERKKFKSFITKEKASQALATFSDAGEFRRALALSGTIGNGKINPNCPRQ